MQTVVELPKFAEQAEKLRTADEHSAFVSYLAYYPDTGDEIPGTGGVCQGDQGQSKGGYETMKKKSTFGSDLIEAMGQAVAHISGDPVDGVRTHHVVVDDVDAKAIRKELKLSQEQMASYLGTSVSGYRKWEQGQRQPSGAARNLLRVIAKEPEAVLRALKVA